MKGLTYLLALVLLVFCCSLSHGGFLNIGGEPPLTEPPRKNAEKSGDGRFSSLSIVIINHPSNSITHGKSYFLSMKEDFNSLAPETKKIILEIEGGDLWLWNHMKGTNEQRHRIIFWAKSSALRREIKKTAEKISTLRKAKEQGDFETSLLRNAIDDLELYKEGLENTLGTWFGERVWRSLVSEYTGNSIPPPKPISEEKYLKTF